MRAGPSTNGLKLMTKLVKVEPVKGAKSANGRKRPGQSSLNIRAASSTGTGAGANLLV